VRTTSGHAKKAGSAPGTVIYTGDRDSGEPVRVTAFDYDGDRLIEKEGLSPAECGRFLQSESVTWINVDGVHDAKLVQQVCEEFRIHPLTIEDICSIGQRPKIEEYPSYVFIIIEALELRRDGDRQYVIAEQVSIIMGPTFVLTFQEAAGDGWDPVRKRLRAQAGRLRRDGADYLTYALLDAVVDDYFVVIGEIGQEIDGYEDEAFTGVDRSFLQRVHDLKRQLLVFRQAVWPLREVTGHLTHADTDWIKPGTAPFLRDLHDHVTQVIETGEIYRESATALIELYLASSGNRLNEVMKVLTILATIFIPVTFVAGIYGMNFDYMPEIHWRLGYPFSLLSMWCIAAGLVWYFKRQGWL
jgi:magnesium transporter